MKKKFLLLNPLNLENILGEKRETGGKTKIVTAASFSSGKKKKEENNDVIHRD